MNARQHPATIAVHDRKAPELSVVIPISERYSDVRALYTDYKRAISSAVGSFEFIYVLDGVFEEPYRELLALRAEGEPIRLIRLTRSFGEASALTHGVEQVRADKILILPAYYQVAPESLAGFIESWEDEDMLVARRWPRVDSKLNRAGTLVFHRILRFVTDYRLRDIGCGVRLVRRHVFREIHVYGENHRFLPILAAHRGFRIREVDLPQAHQDPKVRLYRPGIYLRRILDLLAVFFLVRFTKRPLRFFGLLGSALVVAATPLLAALVFERLVFGTALADRPSLLLASLLLVLGVQLFALGLIGELIIFTHARELKEYAIAETVNMLDPSDEQAPRQPAPTSAHGFAEPTTTRDG